MITVDLNYLNIRKGGNALDIGCGSGRHTAALFDLNRAFVVGADPNISDLQQASKRLRLHADLGGGSRRTWSLTAADITRLPFASASLDVVICSEVLEHIQNHHQAVSELKRVLKPSGDLVISVPRRWPELICWVLSRAYRNTPGGHIRIYRSGPLIQMVRSMGFELRHMHHAHSLHAPYWWLKCLVGIERDNVWPVQVYHRFLTWDMMTQPRLTRLLERWLNPVMGKSVVLYFRKVQ